MGINQYIFYINTITDSDYKTLFSTDKLLYDVKILFQGKKTHTPDTSVVWSLMLCHLPDHYRRYCHDGG